MLRKLRITWGIQHATHRPEECYYFPDRHDIRSKDCTYYENDDGNNLFP